MTRQHRADKLARLMVAPKLQFISPLQLAEKQERLAGSVPVSALRRLTELLYSDKGSVKFDLQFNKDDQGRAVIKGEFSVTLIPTCQRCMQPMDLSLGNEISLAVVNPGDKQDLSDGYEPLTLIDTQIALETLLEEEILLAMPIAPVHGGNNCKGSDLMDKYKARPDSPFAVLKDLKIDKQ